MDEEDIQLPTIPHVSSDLHLPRPPFLRLNSRKRSTRSDELQDDDALSTSLHTSSDPALFSSDETPDAENYLDTKRRKKKTYAGTWWGERLGSRSRSRGLSSNGSSRKAGKRKFTRNFDSGIFMNSDDGSTGCSSDSSFGNDLMETQRQDALKDDGPKTPVRATAKPGMRATSASPQTPKTPRTVRKIVHQETKEQVVMDVVRKCLDDSKEDVDLSGMGLDQLPLEIRELATMIKGDPANEIQFDSLVARPRLYLSNNLLRQFPTPLLELSNLRLLSLRQNKLMRLPPGIRSLVKLETLNISGNRLESLPVEVLDLMINARLRALLSEPNPWLAPTKEQEQARHTRPRLSSRPQFYTLRPNPKQSDADKRLILQLAATSEARSDVCVEERQIPSLSELVLRQLSRLNNSKRDLSLIMGHDAPKNVVNMLQDLHAAQADGDRQCVGCKRLCVRPAMTWIEWWDVSLVEGGAKVQFAGDSAARVLPFEIGICGGCV